MRPLVEEMRQEILPILERYEATMAWLFGCCVRGEMREDSDIDILVDIGRNISLFDFVGLKIEIEEALGRKVDLAEYDTVKPLLRDRILDEQVVIL